MKPFQALNHMQRNNERLTINVRDLKDLIEHQGEVAEYLAHNEIKEFFKRHFPYFTHDIYVPLNRWQQAIVDNYKRPVSYAELLHVHNWWGRFNELPKRIFPRLDQHDPFLAAKGYLEQEKLIQQIGSIKAGIKNPLERQHDLLIVVGTGSGFREQLESVTEPHDTVAVNGAAIKTPCDFFYSIHGSYLKKWKPEMAETTKTVCEWWVPGVDSAYGIFNEELAQLNQFHYSGNMAALFGLMMGYPRILMVGCPLSTIAVDSYLHEYNGKVLEIDTWEQRLQNQMPVIQGHFLKAIGLFPEMVDRIRSISGGFTQRVLGSNFDEPSPVAEFGIEVESCTQVSGTCNR